VAFKTVPSDSTGVAHILEHTVLCGSERFPVRDPFFSMLKRSLSTFMNAFTASDWTMYPFATQNRKDYYNLMDVYLDAAFFPNIDELSFKQEGHRLEVGRRRNRHPLVYKGVVYNEMKGAMSSPDQVMVRSMLNALYPDTTYSNNSGGEPSVIPRSPMSSSKRFMPATTIRATPFSTPTAICRWKTTWLSSKSGCLSRFHASIREPMCPPNPGGRRRNRGLPYPLDPSEDPAKKYQACVAWLLTDIKDTFEVLGDGGHRTDPHRQCRIAAAQGIDGQPAGHRPFRRHRVRRGEPGHHVFGGPEGCDRNRRRKNRSHRL
jgi:Zn-dependent M16 (insulinase) family peptidase